MPWRKVWVYALLFLFFIVTACNHDENQQLSVDMPQPDPAEIEQVIDRFLQRENDVPFQLWAEVNGKPVASMKGTTEENRWKLEGVHVQQSFVRLSGRGDEVEWQTNNDSGVREHTVLSLYSPHEHLKQIKSSVHDFQWAPDNRFESPWTSVRMSLTDDKVKQVVQTVLGEKFATPDIVQNIVQKMEIRYTLWYNKRSLDLHQVKMDLVKKGVNTHRLTQSLTYLFGESSE